MRELTVLYVAPGRADMPGTGEKIAMITVECRGVFETLMLKLRDTALLSEGLLRVLEHHGPPEDSPWVAANPVTGTPDAANVTGNTAEKHPASSPPAKPEIPATTPAPSPGIWIDLVYRDGVRRQLKIVGGYRSGSRAYLLYEYHHRSRGSRSLLRIEGPKVLSFLSHDSEVFLPYSRWAWFDKLRGGARFRIGSHAATKMTAAALERATRFGDFVERN